MPPMMMPSTKLMTTPKIPMVSADARPVDDPRQHVPAQPVGAQKEHRAALGRADQMQVRLDQPPELVLVAPAEEAQPLHVLAVVGVDAPQRLHVQLHRPAIDERPDEAAVVEQPHPLRRLVDMVDVARVQVVGRQELADQRGRIHEDQEDARDHRDPVAAEPPPHQPHLRRLPDPVCASAARSAA